MKACIDCKHCKAVSQTWLHHEYHYCKHPACRGEPDAVTGRILNVDCQDCRSDTKSYSLCKSEGLLWEPSWSRRIKDAIITLFKRS